MCLVSIFRDEVRHLKDRFHILLLLAMLSSVKCVYVWGMSHAKGGPGKPAVWPSRGQMEWQTCEPLQTK